MQGGEGGLLPEAAAADVAGEGVDEAEHDEAFDGAGDEAEG